MDTQALITAASDQAIKAGISINTETLANIITAGLPSECEFSAPERNGDTMIAISGDVLTVKVDGKVVKTASVAAVGPTRLLVQYAISMARTASRVGTF